MPRWIPRTLVGVLAVLFTTSAFAAAPPWRVGLSGVSDDGTGVDVVIIGEGVDHAHPAFGGAIDPADGYDFAGADGQTPDADPGAEGRLAAGPTASGTAIAGVLTEVAPGARLRFFKVSDAEGRVSRAALIAALERAVTDLPPVVIVGIPTDVPGDLGPALAAIDTLIDAGALVVAPAGDAGRGSFGLAWPNANPAVLTVAATAPPGVPTVTLDVEAPATVAGRFALAATTTLPERIAGRVALWTCTTTSAPAEANIGLVGDTTCLQAIAQAAQAHGVDALLVPAAPGLLEVFRPEPVNDVPLLGVEFALAGRMSTSLGAGTPVTVAIDDALAADARLVDTVAHLSSRGPWRDGDALRAEPELSAPGQHMLLPVAGGDHAEQSGTTLAAAYVAGVAAVLRDARGWDATALRARLVGVAAEAWSAPRPLSGGNPSIGGAGGTSPLTIGGAGRVDAQRALAGGLVVYEQSGRMVLDAGAVTVSEATTVTRTLVLENTTASALDVELTVAFRDAADAQGGVVVTLDPASVSLAPDATQTVTVTFTIDPAKLRELASRPSATSLGSYDPIAAWTADEVDGFVRVVTTTGGADEPRVSVPFWIAPRAGAATRAASDTCLAPEAFELGLVNAEAPSHSELFTLVTDDLGAREANEAGVALLQLALTDDGPMAVTLDADGAAPWDHVVLAVPEGLFMGGLATGRELAVLLEPASAELPDAPGMVQLSFGRFVVKETRLVIAEPLAPMRVVTASRALIGQGAKYIALTPYTSATTSLSTELHPYDPACGYALEDASLLVSGAVPLTLVSGPACATPARGLLALHFGNAADAVERIVAPTTAVYTCDPQVLDIADPDTCTATTDFRPYVHGSCASVATVTPSDTGLGLGTHAVTLSIEDPFGNTTTCTTSLEVTDGAPPEITCGDIAAGLSAGMLPLDHTVTASDACGGTATVEVVGYRCLVVQDDTITFDLDDGCGAALDASTMTVVAVDSPANLFEWSVLATDSVGNEVVERCYAAVDREGVGAQGGGGCAGGGASLLGALVIVALSWRRRGS